MSCHHIMSTFETSSFLLKSVRLQCPQTSQDITEHHLHILLHHLHLRSVEQAEQHAWPHMSIFLFRNGMLAPFVLATDLVPVMDMGTMPSHPLLPDEKVYTLQSIPNMPPATSPLILLWPKDKVWHLSSKKCKNIQIDQESAKWQWSQPMQNWTCCSKLYH